MRAAQSALETARAIVDSRKGTFPSSLRPAARRVLSLHRARATATRRVQWLAYAEQAGDLDFRAVQAFISARSRAGSADELNLLTDELLEFAGLVDETAVAESAWNEELGAVVRSWSSCTCSCSCS